MHNPGGEAGKLRRRIMTRIMYDRLLQHIAARVRLTVRESEECTGYFLHRSVRKRQYLLQEGDVCRQIAFVGDGCLREFTVDHTGTEHTLQFAIAGWWISDLNSFLSGRPSAHNIVAVHDSSVLLLDKEGREKLFAAVPKMERYFRLLLEANHVASHKRINETLSASAEERYLSFLKTYPALIEQVPQHQIASFLGITPQSLSRIRRELVHRHP